MRGARKEERDEEKGGGRYRGREQHPDGYHLGEYIGVGRSALEILLKSVDRGELLQCL